MVKDLLSSHFLSLNIKIKIYRTVIKPVILCGCETWSPILREEQSLIEFENRVLRKTFGPYRQELTVDWRKLHNGALHGFYLLSNIIKVIKSMRMRWTEYVVHKGRIKICTSFDGEA